jgi:translation initiation factor IF-2
MRRAAARRRPSHRPGCQRQRNSALCKNRHGLAPKDSPAAARAARRRAASFGRAAQTHWHRAPQPARQLRGVFKTALAGCGVRAASVARPSPGPVRSRLKGLAGFAGPGPVGLTRADPACNHPTPPRPAPPTSPSASNMNLNNKLRLGPRQDGGDGGERGGGGGEEGGGAYMQKPGRSAGGGESGRAGPWADRLIEPGDGPIRPPAQPVLNRPGPGTPCRSESACARQRRRQLPPGGAGRRPAGRTPPPPPSRGGSGGGGGGIRAGAGPGVSTGAGAGVLPESSGRGRRGTDATPTLTSDSDSRRVNC